jgi:hypothetical protein
MEDNILNLLERLKRTQFSRVDVSGLRNFSDMFSLRDKRSGQLQSHVRV